MSRPELWRLQDTVDIAATLEESLLNNIGLMPYNDDGRGWRQRVRSSQDMLNHRMPSCGMQNLGQGGFHPGSLPRCEDHNVNVRRCVHSPDPLRRSIAA